MDVGARREESGKQSEGIILDQNSVQVTIRQEMEQGFSLSELIVIRVF